VLIEKPLATTAALAAEIVEAGERAGVTVMCDHTYCYTPAVRRIRHEIAAGTLGEIQNVDSVRINLGIVQRDTNVFWDLLPHDLSIFDSILPAGSAPYAVSALGVDPIGAGQICVGHVTMLLPGDAIAHVHVSWLSPVKIRTFFIGGSRRHLLWNDNDPTQRISLYERGVDIELMEDSDDQRARMVQYRIGDMLAPALEEGEALQVAAREFADAIRSGRPPLTDGHSGLRVLNVLEAVEESHKNGGALVDVRTHPAR
jgi:predicted dehydrogenase